MGCKSQQRDYLAQGEQPFPARTRPPRNMPRFYVAAGTPVSVRKVTDDDNDWRDYVTIKPIAVERFERYVKDPDAGTAFYIFRVSGWLVMVARYHVVHREDVLRGLA
jgi:hypothetical protein